MDIKLADKEDICNVTALRMMYLKEAYGGLTKEEEKIIQNSKNSRPISAPATVPSVPPAAE